MTKELVASELNESGKDLEVEIKLDSNGGRDAIEAEKQDAGITEKDAELSETRQTEEVTWIDDKILSPGNPSLQSLLRRHSITALTLSHSRDLKTLSLFLPPLNLVDFQVLLYDRNLPQSLLLLLLPHQTTPLLIRPAHFLTLVPTRRYLPLPASLSKKMMETTDQRIRS